MISFFRFCIEEYVVFLTRWPPLGMYPKKLSIKTSVQIC